jgi:hypothetical protein
MAIDNQKTQIIIEDHVVPQLLTSAIEAYAIGDTTSQRGKTEDKLETFGLLWGYTLPEREGFPPRVVAVLATVETSAYRHNGWVMPSLESLGTKREFFEAFWPNLELVGTFHSHPYSSIEEIEKVKGWRASGEDDGSGDYGYWPHMHEEICSDIDHLAHLIISVVDLNKRSTRCPDRLAGNEAKAGYTFGAGRYRMWIRGYSTFKVELANYIHQHEKEWCAVDAGFEQHVINMGYQVAVDGSLMDAKGQPYFYKEAKDIAEYYVDKDIELHIPSLLQRFF